MKTENKFGGSLLTGKRKSARPIYTKRAMHLVLKAAEFRLKKNEHFIRVEVGRAAKKWGVSIYQYAIASDHIHLLIRVPTRRSYRYFIQRISGVIALKLNLKWAFRPFTRVVEWGLGYKRAKNYIRMNFFEAMGFVDYQAGGRGALRRRLRYIGASI